MWGIIVALSSGILMSVQGVFNTEATRQSGLWLCSAFVQLTAFGICVAAWMISERTPIDHLWQIRPWYLLLGGVLGAFITITVVQSMGKLGPAQAAMLIVTWRKLLGAAVAIAGIILFKWE